MMSLSVQAILHGQLIELGIADEHNDGWDNKVWLSLNDARELSTCLMRSVADAYE